MLLKKRTSDLLIMLENEFKKLGVEEKLSKDLPSTLFRYCAVTEYLVSNISNNEVTAVSPVVFNDIFDTEMIIGNQMSINRAYNERQKIARSAGYEWPQSEEEFSKLMENRFETYKNFAKNEVMISSFTEDRDSNFMWAHYANSNKGICLEYETNFEIFDYIFPVIYGDNQINVEQLVQTETDKSIESAIFLSTLYKNASWMNEKEWRLIFPNLNGISSSNRHNPENLYFPVKINTPKSITLGIRFFEDILNTDHTLKRNHLALIKVLDARKIAVYVLAYNYKREVQRKKLNISILNDYLAENSGKKMDLDKLNDIIDKIYKYSVSE